MGNNDPSAERRADPGAGDALPREPEILVVEDDPATRHGLYQLLRDWGFEVSQASDGANALELLSSGSSIGLVVTDLVMPRLDGLGLLQAVREEWPHIDVILLTAQGSVETAVEAIKLGAFDYLTKPVDIQRLRFLVERHFEKVELMAPRPPTAAAPRDASTSGIFLCYRRDDTQDAAGRLHDRLVAAYGRDRVFMDIDSMPLAVDFAEHVAQQIAKCSAVIVMIGKQWLTIKDKKRRRRLDAPDDLVRSEVRAALQQKIPVIPVVVQNALMPHADDLPEDIRPLARRNGIELSATRWSADVERLVKELDRLLKA